MRQTIVSILLSALFVMAFFSCKQSGSDNSGNDSINDGLATLNAAIDNDKGNAGLYIQRAAYYLEHESLNNSLNDINKAIQLDPKSEKAYTTLSSIYLLMGKPQESLDALNRVLSFDAKNPDIFLKKAKLYLVMKDYENCAASVEQALQINPNLADAYYLKGMALMENEKMDLAIVSFQRAVTIDQKHFDALMQLGYIWEAKDTKMSIDYFNSALLADPTSSEASYNLGLLYQEHGEPQKAIKSYETIVQHDPKNKLAHYNTGYVNLVYLNNYSKAVLAFSKAIEQDSLYADAWFNRGYSFELQGELEKAAKDYQTVLKLKTNDTKAIEGLNRLDEARKKKK